MMEAKNIHLLEITLLIGALGRAAKGAERGSDCSRQSLLPGRVLLSSLPGSQEE